MKVEDSKVRKYGGERYQDLRFVAVEDKKVRNA
jgi:hypothetical protein